MSTISWLQRKAPCACGSGATASQCCDPSSRKKNNETRAAKVAVYQPKGFPITTAQLRYADPKAVGRLLWFLGLSDVRNYEELAKVLNEGVTVWKRAHIAVNSRKASGSPP